jgi:hypothetical protein
VFVAGTVTDFFTPSSVMAVVFGTQLAGALTTPARSNANSAVSADGQEMFEISAGAND